MGLKLRIHMMPYLDPGSLPRDLTRFAPTSTCFCKNAYTINGTFRFFEKHLAILTILIIMLQKCFRNAYTIDVDTDDRYR